MELQGSLETIQIGDIVQILEARHSTGLLRLDNGHGRSSQVYFRGGRIVHVVGPNGSTSPFVFSELFDWESVPGARFEFDSKVPLGPETLKSSNVTLLMEAAVAKDVLARFREKYGSAALLISLSTEPPRLQVEMCPEDWVVLRCLGPGKSLLDVLAESQAEPTEFVDSVVKLADAGIIVLSPAPEAAEVEPPREAMQRLIAASDAVLDAFCRELGPMVVENFAQQSIAVHESRYLGLTAIQIRQDGEVCRVVAEDMGILAAGFQNSADGLSTALRAVLTELKRRCGAIVRPIGRARFTDLLSPDPTPAAVLGFAEDAK